MTSCSTGEDSSWRKQWVELYRDGFFKYYESDHSPNAEDTIFMPTECSSIRTGSQVDISATSSLPAKHSSLCLFSVGTSNKIWIFITSSLDDMRSWQLALEQARLLVVQPPHTPTTTTPIFPQHYFTPMTTSMSAYMQTYPPALPFIIPQSMDMSCSRLTYPAGFPYFGQSLSPAALELSVNGQSMHNCCTLASVPSIDMVPPRSDFLPSTPSSISRPMAFGVNPPFWW